MKLTKKDRLEAYEKIFSDDKDYINSFLNTDKYPIHIYNEKDGNKPFFEGYRPNYYFKTNEEKVDTNILSKIINESANQIPEYTSISSKGFTLDDMYKAMEQLEKLSPTPIEIEIGRIAWEVLTSKLKIHVVHDSSKFSTLFGVRIILSDSDQIKFNQMRVKYNNGDSKIIDVFEYNCDYDYIYKNIFMED